MAKKILAKSGKKIQVKFVGKDAHTAYVELPGHRPEAGIVSRSVRLDGLIEDYKGPAVNLDFDQAGLLIGIEILVYPSEK
jgi:hypothetical protein